MKASELRIGNFLYNSLPGHPTLLNTVDSQTIRLIELKAVDNFTPIPLSEEWLVKFGWIWNEECNSFEKYPNGDVGMNLQRRPTNGSYTMFNYVLKAIIAERIFYVHQLQNLYFALTGGELK